MGKLEVENYKKLFEIDGVELDVENGAIEAVADKAVMKNTGARGLRSIFENVMRDVMYEVPSRDDVKKCIITKDTVENDMPPTLVFADTAAASRKTADETA